MQSGRFEITTAGLRIDGTVWTPAEYQTIKFSTPFVHDDIIVLCTIQTKTQGDGSRPRVKNVNRYGFEVIIEEHEATDIAHLETELMGNLIIFLILQIKIIKKKWYVLKFRFFKRSHSSKLHHFLYSWNLVRLLILAYFDMSKPNERWCGF